MLDHQSHHQRKLQRRAGWRALPIRLLSPIYPPGEITWNPWEYRQVARGATETRPLRNCSQSRAGGKLAWQLRTRGNGLCVEWLVLLASSSQELHAVLLHSYGGDMWKKSGCEHCMRAPIQFQLLGFKLVTSRTARIQQNFENSITSPCEQVYRVFN